MTAELSDDLLLMRPLSRAVAAASSRPSVSHASEAAPRMWSSRPRLRVEYWDEDEPTKPRPFSLTQVNHQLRANERILAR
jgi:hypothetical protein